MGHARIAHTQMSHGRTRSLNTMRTLSQRLNQTASSSHARLRTGQRDCHPHSTPTACSAHTLMSHGQEQRTHRNRLIPTQAAARFHPLPRARPHNKRCVRVGAVVLLRICARLRRMDVVARCADGRNEGRDQSAMCAGSQFQSAQRRMFHAPLQHVSTRPPSAASPSTPLSVHGPFCREQVCPAGPGQQREQLAWPTR